METVLSRLLFIALSYSSLLELPRLPRDLHPTLMVHTSPNRAIRRPPPAVSHPSSASGDPFGDGSYTAFSRENLEEVRNYTARLFAPRKTTAYAPVRLRFVDDPIDLKTSSSEDRISIMTGQRGARGYAAPVIYHKPGQPVVYLKDTWQRDSATPKAGRTVLPTPFSPPLLRLHWFPRQTLGNHNGHLTQHNDYRLP